MNRLTDIKNKMAPILATADFEFAGVFGSFARGEQNEKSDIDIFARFSKPKSLLDLIRIERELSERAGRTVDLVTEGALSPYIREQVFREMQTVYEK